jgi:hypothetical protein
MYSDCNVIGKMPVLIILIGFDLKFLHSAATGF